MTQPRRRGRPISASLDGRLFDAAAALLDERRSFEALTIDALCQRAGASKASFYRRWPDRDAFVLAMMDSLRMPPLPDGPGASLADDLVAILEGMFGVDVRRTRVVHSALIAEGRRNLPLIAAYMRRIVKPRRTALTARLRRAVEDGDLRTDTDIAILHEALTAPVLKIMLLQDPDTPIPRNFARRLVDQVLRGVVA